MTEDLIAFIRAQLDDDERVAREATPGPWSATPSTDSVYAKPSSVVVLTNVELHAEWSPSWTNPYVVPPQEEGREGIEPVDAEHIARWDPARVLAEIEAKRRIIAHIGMVVISPGREALPPEYVEQMEVFARILALPYADRDGYREDWRP